MDFAPDLVRKGIAMRGIALVLCLFATLAAAQTGCSAAPAPATAAAAAPSYRPAELSGVFARIRAARAEGKTPLAIFDIDGTILDTAARTRDIFAAALDGPGAVVTPEKPELAARIRQLPLADYADEPESTLARVGIVDTAFVRALKTRWNQDFFSNRYLLRDTAIPGAPAYLDSLHAAGCMIVYCTGRDAPRMLGGTAASLLDRGFPVGIPRTQLVMKPDKAIPDFDYKKAALADFALLGTVVAVYENEPRNINLLHSSFPSALAYYVDTKHSTGAPPVDPGIVWVQNYLAPDR
jgi:beta-phosphoglucomutase-like phosphatase (HAD superfamily)